MRSFFFITAGQSILVLSLLFLSFQAIGKSDTLQANKDWLEAEKQNKLLEYRLAGPLYLNAQMGFLKAKAGQRAADCLQNAAICFRKDNKGSKILETIQQYRTGLKKVWNQEAESNVSMAMIEYYFSKRNLDSAEIQARKAIEIRKSIFGNGHIKMASCYTSLGIILDYKEDGKGSLGAFKTVLEIALKNFSPPHDRIRRALNNVGNAYGTLLDYKTAKKYYHQSLEMTRQLYGQWSMETETSINNLSHVSTLILDFDSSIYFKEQLRELFTNNLGKNHLNTLMNESRIGDNLIQKGQYDEAIRLFNQLIDKLSTFSKGDYSDLSYQYGQVADSYIAKEEYEKAEIYYQKALNQALSDFGNSRIVIAVYYYGIGQCQQSRDENEAALQNFKKAFSIQFPVLGPTSGNIAMIYDEIAQTFFNLNQLDSASYFYQQAHKIYQVETDLEYKERYATSMVQLGKVWEQKGDFEKAIHLKKQGISLIRETFPFSHPNKSGPYFSLAKTYEKMGQTKMALSNVWKAMNENAISGFDTLQGQGWVGPNGVLDKENHVSHLLKASQLLTKLQKPNLTRALHLLLLADSLLIQLQKARTLESDQIKLGEEIRSISGHALFILQNLQIQNPIQTINGQSIKELIFYFASRRQASTLNLALATNKAKKISGIPPDLLEKERSLKNQIKVLEKNLSELPKPKSVLDSAQKEVITNKLFDLYRENDNLNSSIEKDFPRFKGLKNISSFPNQVDIQSVLLLATKKTALVSLIWDDKNPFLYVIGAGFEQLLPLRTDSIAEKKLFGYRVALRKGLIDVSLEIGEQLYTTHFQKLDQWLTKKKIEKIVWVTEGIWSTFPFETLPYSSHQGKKYWIEKYEMAYSQSIPLWIENQKTASIDLAKRGKHLKCLAFAPVFSDKETNFLVKACESFVRQYNQSAQNENAGSSSTRAFDANGGYINPLPFTEEEVVQISGLFKKDNNLFFKYFVKKDAVEGRFKTREVEGADIIHLATHGIVNEEKPELSGLLFHPTPKDSTEDGILYTGEIYGLQLHADLVTLSACETGLGKIKTGEGMLGLTRSFTFAGARNLVVSLWKVSDKATSELMIEFYNQLLIQLPKSESLRKAKLKLLKNKATSNPYYWAPFVLVEG